MRVRTKLYLFRFGFAAALLGAVAIASSAQERDRTKIPDQYKWDLTVLYPTDQAWRSAKEKLVAELPKLKAHQGTLASSGQRLADALETESRMDKELGRLGTYAGLISDQDTRVSTYQGMQQEVVQLQSMFRADSAFIDPEILKIDNATMLRFIAQEPRLQIYRHYLDNIARRRPHTLDEAEEKLLATSTVMASGPSNTYSILSDADFQYPTISLSDGKTAKLTSAAYTLHRTSPIREDREKVMASFF